MYIDVNSESNLFLSTYDMELYVDDRSLGFVANGKTFTKMIEVAEGKHEFIAYKSGSNDIYASTIIDVMEDMTFKCDISHSNSISFKNISTENSITGTSLDVPNVVGMLLSDAIKRMETIGFSNVREEPFNDIWDRTNWIVVSQGIQAGEK